jgi:cyclophilin family peptidyl-prolyl cis-trans isomerase
MRYCSVVLVCLLTVFAGGVVSSSQADQIVRLQTNRGDITLNLYDEVAPVEVANFLTYVQSGAFDSTFFHRSVPGFVLQGGGFTVDGKTIGQVATNAPIADNYGLANTRGTLAMAKSSLPDSATSQFFINLVDNKMCSGRRARTQMAWGTWYLARSVQAWTSVMRSQPGADMTCRIPLAR